MPLFLSSLGFDGLSHWLDEQGAEGHVAVIGNASRRLPDGEAIVAAAIDELWRGGRPSHLVDVTDDVSALQNAAAIVMTGGDPFQLLADLKVAGVNIMLEDAHRRGVPVAGQSAGAIVCGPDLGPITVTSPFSPPPGLPLAALRLTEKLVLPHHGRPGRTARHRLAATNAENPAGLVALWDDEVLMEADGDWIIRRGRQTTRRAAAPDAAAVAEVFHQAALAAWGPFLGADALEAHRQPPSVWAERIRGAGDRFLVTEDRLGVCAFVHWRPAEDGTTGELDLLYAHPRAWGDGSSRRLLHRATWQLLCEGFRAAVLWTEARNDRALAVYRANGWRRDGGVDERSFAGMPIRNLRHRLDLGEFAGGH